ncbi:MAG: hypothetical protein PHI77_02210 [Candidatus Pacebacteria bacterium]|jgi:predicted neutral ceramidase superfamily lipid hydrolase|nr:hypothetical protein [Candidatus Paceibacterota bacterium]MDD4875200.1 hypothetical protein [Candidatus Paceibacterota bacterium]
MLKKIKQLAKALLVLFLGIILFVAILTIWDVVNQEAAKEALIKSAYTCSAIFILSLIVIYITKK